MNEVFYTFLVPVIFEYEGRNYMVWGYREVDGEVVCFTATQTSEQKWTDPTPFDDKKLIAEFKKYLPEQPVKRKRRKRE